MPQVVFLICVKQVILSDIVEEKYKNELQNVPNMTEIIDCICRFLQVKFSL